MKRGRVKDRCVPALNRRAVGLCEDVPREDHGCAVGDVKGDGDEEVMRHRKTPDNSVIVVDAERLVRRCDPITNRVMAQHHAFACAGGAGGKSDERDVEAVVVRGHRRVRSRQETIFGELERTRRRRQTNERLNVERFHNADAFGIGAFHRQGDHHRAEFPQGKGKRDAVYTIREVHTHALAGADAVTGEGGRQLVRSFYQVSVGNGLIILDERRLFGPPGGRVVQQFDQIHSSIVSKYDDRRLRFAGSTRCSPTAGTTRVARLLRRR